MWTNFLWGKNAKFRYLLLAAVILLLSFLGSHDIWTQEHRWADIVYGMFYRHDFFHPYLNDVDYYDKPLLSYWLIAAFSYITGLYSTWAMRLPSALAGLLALWSIYRIGTVLKNKELGLMSAWMLLTSYYFVFWARTSSADMLNLGGILFALAWFFEKKDQPSFFNYSIFFLIIAVTSLCKGLIGAVVPILVLLPYLLMEKEWQKHLRISLFLALIPAAVVYLLPFLGSAYFGNQGYGENGLYLVYRENILRYFQPFDHKGPFYTYFIFLPVYLLQWTLFFIPALFALKSRWSAMTKNSKWIVWATLLLFVFLTLSGSRRNYYVLPLVPFAILLTADWISATAKTQMMARFAIVFYALLVLNFSVFQPLYYSHGGFKNFGETLKPDLQKLQVVMLDPESKVRFYMNLSPEVKNYSIQGKRKEQTTQSLLTAWPILNAKPTNTVFVTRKMYLPLLENQFPGYKIVIAKDTWGERLFRVKNLNAPVAFVPQV